MTKRHRDYYDSINNTSKEQVSATRAVHVRSVPRPPDPGTSKVSLTYSKRTYSVYSVYFVYFVYFVYSVYFVSVGHPQSLTHVLSHPPGRLCDSVLF